MRNNKSVKIIVFSALAALILLFAIIFAAGTHSKKQVLGFYRTSPKVQAAVISVLEANDNSKIQIINFDDEKTLDEQKNLLNKCSLLIFTNDAESQNYLEKKSKALSISFTEGFPSSIISSLTISEKNTVKILPFLYDFYEIDVHYPTFLKSGQKNVDVFLDLIELAWREKDSTRAPLLIPIANDSLFLDYVGVIAEALCGYEAYENMIKEMMAFGTGTGKEDFQETLTKYLEENQPLGKAAAEIKSLLRSGILPRESLKLNEKDILFYLENELCGIAFTSLSQHRQIPSRSAANYTSIYCPSTEFTPERKFAAVQFSVTALKSKKSTEKLIKNLVTSYQNTLATESGLAPVQKNSAVPDHQADDVRFWLAASKGPVMPLSRTMNAVQAEQTAQILREMLLE